MEDRAQDRSRTSVATIVVCLGKAPETRKCLTALRGRGPSGQRIVVVENGTTENRRTLSAEFPEVRFVSLPSNQGFAGGNNRGILEARSLWEPDYYFLLNNDAEIAPGCLDALIAAAESDPRCGLAGPKILTDLESGTIWAAGGEFQAWRCFVRNRGQGEHDAGQYDRPEAQGFLSGCALLIRRDAVESVGLFDERYFCYSEDLDLCLRAAQAGWRLRYVPNAVVFHRGSGTAGGQYRPFQSFYRWRNRLLTASKHARASQKLWLYPIFFPLLFVRDSLTYLRLGHVQSFPFLWRGLLQFLDLWLFGSDADPLDDPSGARSGGRERPRKRWGLLARSPVLILALKALDFLGCRFFRARTAPGLPQKPAKILIAKIDHLGDVLLSLNAVAALKQAQPQAELHFLCGSWARPLLAGHPGIDRLFTFDHALLNRKGPLPARLARMLRDFFQLIAQLRRERYDAAVDLRAYFPNALPLLRLTGAREVIGFATGGLGFALHRQVHWREGAHETDHSFDALRLLGADPDIKADLSYLGDGAAPPALAALGLASGDRFVLLQPGSGRPTKRWRAEQWRRLIGLIEDEGRRAVLAGSADERGWVDELASGTSAINLCGRTDFAALVALARRAESVIGMDSFLPHLAAALGKRTVALFNGIERIEQWRPQGENVTVLTKPVPCSPCYLNGGCAAMDCLELTAEQVMAAAGIPAASQ